MSIRMLYFPLLVVLALDSCAGYHSLTGHARFFSQKVPSSALFDGIDNDVLGIAQSFLSGKLGINTASTLADEVRLVGPASAVNGKSNYLTATKKDTENLLQIMPDYSLGEYSLQIDETNNNIVYAFLRPKGTFSSPVVLGKDVITPTKETIKFPIEHVTLALKSNKITQISLGYVADRLTGNTGGLSGYAGLLSAAGVGPSSVTTLPPAVVIQRLLARNRKPVVSKAATFPFPEAVMISLARQVISSDLGTVEPSLLSDDFQFSDPFIGPLPKVEYLKSSVSLQAIRKEFIADFSIEAKNFHVDVNEPDRVWAVVNYRGQSFATSPELVSLSFNSQGLCYRLTAGYVIDRTAGDSKGLGHVYGLREVSDKPLSPLQTRSVPAWIYLATESLLNKASTISTPTIPKPTIPKPEVPRSVVPVVKVPVAPLPKPAAVPVTKVPVAPLPKTVVPSAPVPVAKPVPPAASTNAASTAKKEVVPAEKPAVVEAPKKAASTAAIPAFSFLNFKAPAVAKKAEVKASVVAPAIAKEQPKIAAPVAAKKIAPAAPSFNPFGGSNVSSSTVKNVEAESKIESKAASVPAPAVAKISTAPKFSLFGGAAPAKKATSPVSIVAPIEEEKPIEKPVKPVTKLSSPFSFSYSKGGTGKLSTTKKTTDKPVAADNNAKDNVLEKKK